MNLSSHKFLLSTLFCVLFCLLSPTARAGLPLATALDEMAIKAMQRGVGSMDELAVAFRGTDAAIVNVLESAGKCDLCLTRVETAIDGLKKERGLSNKEALEWISDNGQKFSNGNKELSDDFVFQTLNWCVGKISNPRMLKTCENLANWTERNGGFSEAAQIGTGCLAGILRIRPQSQSEGECSPLSPKQLQEEAAIFAKTVFEDTPARLRLDEAGNLEELTARSYPGSASVIQTPDGRVFKGTSGYFDQLEDLPDSVKVIYANSSNRQGKLHKAIAILYNNCVKKPKPDATNGLCAEAKALSRMVYELVPELNVLSNTELLNIGENGIIDIIKQKLNINPNNLAYSAAMEVRKSVEFPGQLPSKFIAKKACTNCSQVLERLGILPINEELR
jgi:hypothetical protein